MNDLAERYRRLSLRTKFAVHIAVSITALFAVLIPGVAYLQKRAALEQARQRGLELTKVFAHASVQAIVADDFLALRHIVNSLASEADVLYVMVLDPSGRVLVHSDVRKAGESYRDPATAHAIRAETAMVQPAPGVADAYDFVVPIWVLNERRAVARVGLSLEHELAAIRRTRHAIFGLGVIALVGGLALARWQATSVTRPVRELARGAQEIARGNLDHRIALAAGGELGDLAMAFNRMTEAVQALLETSRELSSTFDTDAVLHSIAAHARKLLRADIAAISPVAHERETAPIKIVLGARTPGCRDLVVTPGRGFAGAALATRQPFTTPNYLEDRSLVHDPSFDAVMREEGVVGALAVPITLKQEIVGVLWVANRSPVLFDPQDAESLARMAHQVAIAMDNARLYADTKLKTVRLESLIRVSQAVTSTLDPEQILRAVVRAMTELGQGSAVRLWIRDSGNGRPSVRGDAGEIDPANDALSLCLGEELPSAVMAQRGALVVEDLAVDTRVHRRDLLRLEGFVSFVGLPLLREERVLGALAVVTRTRHRFSDDETALFASFAQHAAIALENARLYQDARRSHERLLGAQEALVRKTRMAAMGEVAAVVAHEIRNPLTALSSSVQELRRNPHLAADEIELLDIIRMETRRLNEIVSDFLAFGRPRPPHRQEVDIHALISETLTPLEGDARRSASIAFIKKFDASVPRLLVDRDQFRQVFWNLFLNAVEAMRGEGELRVETRIADGAVQVAIHDTGPGIPPTAIPRLFEPFYTTKASGTGLGLAIVRRIVEDHGGHVTVHSEPEPGTCFVLSLPLPPPA